MLPDNGRRVKQHFNYHMTLEEVKVILQYVKMHCSLKWEIALLLMLTRGMRPAEVLSLNVLDFNEDYSEVTFREAKTNKIRIKEVVIPEVAEMIRVYVAANTKSRYIVDGYLFPFHNVKSGGLPFMNTETFGAWFSSVRHGIIKEYPEYAASFKERYPFQMKTGKPQMRYRIGLYSFRRFFETSLYLQTGNSLAAVKEIMEYGSKFDPMKHYIKVVHHEDQKGEILRNTFSGMMRGLYETD